MRIHYNSLRDFLARLESEGELIRIKEKVSPILEVTEITDRICKSSDGGKAILFENVDGSDPRLNNSGTGVPVLINTFGSKKRMAMALGVNDVEEVARDIQELIELKPPQNLIEKIKFLPRLFEISHYPPKIITGKATCHEVVLTGDEIDLFKFPILKCWPLDGGRFITLPVVFTKSLKSGKRNVGMYRMQVYDKKTTGMHWHIHKDGAMHYDEYRKAGKRMEVAVAIGTDPVVTYAATAPLPYGIDELLFAGMIRKTGVELVKCKTIDMEVPATAEIVLEGYVEPEELREEGPFGDHTGYYSLKGDYPVFHITAITHRKNLIYSTTIVGKPPMEDCYMGKATERIFLPMLRALNPEIVDIDLPWEGVFHNCVIVSMKKRYPMHARKLMTSLWGSGQMSFSKMILTVDDGINVHNYREIASILLNNINIEKDIFITEGILDVLDHSAPNPLYGSKVGIDATKKIEGEGREGGMRNAECGVRSFEPATHSIKDMILDIENINIPIGNERTEMLFISIKKNKPYHVKSLAEELSKIISADCAGILIVLDNDVDINNISMVTWKIFNNVDPKRDFYFVDRRLIIDATRKWKEEGHARDWPPEIVMDLEVKKNIDMRFSKTAL
ncbi:MAG: menaquinone biosynthesis decarboxylase [Nitrospinae bacterium RIFCSPLOWO2_02_FULL_39_110]|nr:MAG: menaquinone biosynthesis decarboxylase [Nitrospinae bacterium RIFCSPHIGHO2_02_39_11]OGW01062.1 MAG: menaquinone biosynthesis decarboxylase [Nitrospinae bacterium RIFCSPHIGHO2_02_FULL_39_82]OGW01962.1 MAG: menaquinone biosynthesis decarboxylase [Nitrospinae bacterium RIFCSPLOWO2_02_39_17]OGW05152.1 MAG: menaquinone biosynthesis decarboxylase [Nitrospinae bacterium RIFCSPLOWO2_02_FULL_39_110]OGW08580.1 MAG: menaquinone biosynthesis decarboxylase [Nitrospinae bacterium RIFCSPLOWO2_12_39_15